MAASDAVTLIQQRLGWRTDKEAQIIAALNEAAVELETGRSLPPLLLQEDQTLSLTANVAYVAKPADFLKIYDDGWPSYTDSTTGQQYRLIKGRWDDVQQNLVFPIGTDAYASYPVAFAERKTQLWFAPTPPIAMTLTWTYYGKATALSAGGDTNVWLDDDAGFYLLVAKAGLILASDLEVRDEVMRGFMEMETRWERRVFARTIEEDTDDYVQLGDGT